ncbi:MAG TPA: hypothetical protein VNK52_14320 [Hyphomicrobiaceae bacterium]|nr:hypothetical protein [Hyphomicrobiaceae bacterium]
MTRSPTDPLEAKRAELASSLENLSPPSQLADLIRRADAAAAEYKAKAAALESEIARIDAQIGVRERDKRAAADQQRTAEWLEQRKALLEEVELALQAEADAEAASRALAEAITRRLASNARLSKIARALAVNGRMPTALNVMELASRLACRHAAIMATIPGHRDRLGSIAWPAGASGLYPADRNWRAEEERRLMTHLVQPLLEEGKAP